MLDNFKTAAQDFGKTAGSIKDSGNRTEFESGAVRDMQEGKGRCDLMPLDVVGGVLNDINDNESGTVLFNISKFQKSNDTYYLRLALRHFAHYACGTEDARERILTMILEVAKHFEDGAKKYGENNWQKGLPVWSYINSAVRHYLKFMRGDTDERHDRAFVWNLLCCIWTVEHEKVVMKDERENQSNPQTAG